MLYMPTKLLKPGMLLARDVPSGNFALPLMAAGQRLTEQYIRDVADRGIKGLYIDYAGTEDVVFEEYLPPDKKQSMLAEIKSEFIKSQNPDPRMGPNYRAFVRMAESIVMSVLNHDGFLCSVMDLRDYDNYTYCHCLSVGTLSAVLGEHLDLPPAQLVDLTTAGLLHDIGKQDIPASIINKPGKLTDEEFRMIKEHPALAVKRLRSLHGCRDSILNGVAAHHESYDGAGYPLGLAEKQIPLYGRILAMADVYDALCSKRAYREAWTPSQAIDYITSRSGTQFDPELLTVFLGSVAAYPVGSVVRLSDGSVGVVTRNHPGFTLRPSVRLIAPKEREGAELDLSVTALNITVLGVQEEPLDES